MKRWRQALALLGCVGLVVVSFPIVGGLLLGGLLVLGSERSIYQRAKSPDGWHEARVQFDDGGAVSGFSRLVFLKHSWNVSEEPLLSCRAFWGEGEAKVQLSWRDDHTLLIRHHFSPENVRAVADHCGPTRIITQPVAPFERYR